MNTKKDVFMVENTITPEVEAFLAKPNQAVVGVNRANGAPQLTVTWYHWDGKVFFFSTKKDRAKYYNLKRDPSISMVINNTIDNWYIAIYGRAEIIEQNHDEIIQPVIEKYMTPEQRAQFPGSDPDRVIVVIHPERILTGH